MKKLHQVVEKFLLEAELKDYESLDAFNYAWAAYLELNYVDEPHEGLEENYKAQGVEVDRNELTPRKEFMMDILNGEVDPEPPLPLVTEESEPLPF